MSIRICNMCDYVGYHQGKITKPICCFPEHEGIKLDTVTDAITTPSQIYFITPSDCPLFNTRTSTPFGIVE